MRVNAIFTAITILAVLNLANAEAPLGRSLSFDGKYGGRAEKHAFGIYIVAGAVDARDVFAHGSEQWKTLPLQAEPIISDEDIVAYDFSKHAIKLTAEAFKRLPRPSVAGTPFVIVGNGERIYPGAFYSSASSIPCHVPVIVTDLAWVKKSVPPNTIFIERAYPESQAYGKDFRSDDRLRTIFAALKKLAVS